MNNIRSSSDHLDQPMMAWWSEGCKLEPFQPKDIPVLLISFDLILNSHCLYHCLMLVSSFSCSLDRFTHHCECFRGNSIHNLHYFNQSLETLKSCSFSGFLFGQLFQVFSVRTFYDFPFRGACFCLTTSSLLYLLHLKVNEFAHREQIVVVQIVCNW